MATPKTIQIPDNVPVSWLPNHPTLDPEMLFLVSVPSTKTETGFISKYITFRDLRDGLQSLFQIDATHGVVERISGDYFPVLDNLSSNTICCDVANPYIISAIVQKDGNISALEGYRLSSAMNQLHTEVVFDTIKAKKLEIASGGGNNPLRPVYGNQVIYFGLGLNITVGLNTFNISRPSGSTQKKITVTLEELSDEAKRIFAGTQFEFKLLVDNTKNGMVESHTIDWSGLGGEILKEKKSVENQDDDVTIVGANQICLFTVQKISAGSSSQPEPDMWFIQKKVLSRVGSR